MSYKKITQLPDATSVDLSDVLLMTDVSTDTSKKLSVQKLFDIFEFQNNPETAKIQDLWGVSGEHGSYQIHRDTEDNVSNVTQDMGGGVTKTISFNRDTNNQIISVLFSFSDNSFSRLYTLIRDSEERITSVQIS